MYQIVKFNFPFSDDFSKGKPRPALVVSPAFGQHKQVIVAYITTSKHNLIDTDISIHSSKPYFASTGLNNDSVIKLHRLITIESSQIGEEIGQLPSELVSHIKDNLKKIFQL